MTITRINSREIRKKYPLDRGLKKRISEVVDTDEDLLEEMPKGLSGLYRPGRPKKENAKRAVSFRLDPDVIEGLKKTGPNWTSRVNEVMRQHLFKLGLI